MDNVCAASRNNATQVCGKIGAHLNRELTMKRSCVQSVFFLLAVLALVFSTPGGARAQSGIEINNLQIAIWPEYDQPGVLVIYHIALSSQTNLPARLTLSIPSASQKPYNLAMKDVDGLLYNLDYSLSKSGTDWIQVTFTTPVSEIQLEYYDPTLNRSSSERTFEYRWPADYTVQSLAVQVQEPLGAQNVRMNPNLGSGRTAPDGFVYYTGLIGRVGSGTPFFLTLSYSKGDDTLSVKSQPVQAVETVSAQTEGRTTFQEALPITLAAFGLLIVAGGLIWYWQSYRDTKRVPRQRHTPVRNANGNIPNGNRFCQQCGKLAQPGDKFCRSCGVQLRE
jgi:hypothetical protein